MRWFAGILLSFIFAWVVAYYFGNTILPYEWDPTLQKHVIKYGTVRRLRTEGHGTSRIGKFNIHGIPDISTLEDKKKVAFWGDSFVEAWQVNDQEKMAQVFTKRCALRGEDSLIGFGVGRSGASIADYYFDIPRYEDAIKGIIAHCIIFSQSGDILPDQATSLFSTFVSSPEFRLIEKKPPIPGNPNLVARLSRYHLDFLAKAIVSLREQFPLSFFPVRHSLGTGEHARANLQEKEPQQVEKAYSFLIKKFQQQTNIPIFFVYLPRVPRIENGRVVLSNPDKEVKESFSRVCKKYHVGFVDMSDTFIKFYQDTGRFPRGFSNSRPSLGHLNRYGHALVAEKVCQYIHAHGKK